MPESQHDENAGSRLPPVPRAILSCISDSLLGVSTSVHSAMSGEDDALHLRLRPQHWPCQEGEKPTTQTIRRVQQRVTDDMKREMPLVIIGAATSALDGQPEINVCVPNHKERKRRAREYVAAYSTLRALKRLYTIFFAAAIAFCVVSYMWPEVPLAFFLR